MTDVSLISRAPRAFRMMVNGDTRVFEIARGVNTLPQDFLEKWAAQNWDSDILDLLQWPGKVATRRAGAHEVPFVLPMIPQP